PLGEGVSVSTVRPFEVEKLPEIGYYRIGDSWADDQLTFFSANRVGILHYNVGDATLADYGFVDTKTERDSNGKPVKDENGNIIKKPAVLPGLPNLGQTGFTDKHVVRGDFRQEVDYPFQVDKFKVSPYVVGRLTSYSESVDGSTLNRLYGGAGLRMTTAFWKVDDTA